MHETFNQFTRSRSVRYGERRGRGPFRMKRNTRVGIYISRSRWSANRARQAHFRKSIDRETPPFRQSQYAHKSPLYNSGSRQRRRQRRRRRRVELTLSGKFFSNRSFNDQVRSKKNICSTIFHPLLFNMCVHFTYISYYFSRVFIANVAIIELN